MEKSQYSQGYRTGNSEKEQISGYGKFFPDMDKSDGVPFQLIFGQNVGEGIYLHAGAGVRHLLGIEPGDLTERTFHKMIQEIIPLSEDIPSDLISSRSKFIRGEIKQYMAEVLVKLPGGEKKWILDTSVPLIDDETGNVIGATGILYDDSPRKTILEKLLNSGKKAEETDRLKAAFLHNISHEIRTPLNAIVGFSTLLEEYPESAEKRKEYLEIISRSSDHLLEIIDNIVEISKIEAGTIKVSREDVNIMEILNNINSQYGFMASEKGIQLSCIKPCEDKIQYLYTDSYKLTQILGNLLNNAIKFTHEGKIEYGCHEKGTYFEFFVSDTGIGIPEDQQKNIFIRFFQCDNTTRRSYGGTGLGLAISKAYVDLLGGNISFTSKEGTGTTFRFTVPKPL